MSSLSMELGKGVAIMSGGVQLWRSLLVKPVIRPQVPSLHNFSSGLTCHAYTSSAGPRPVCQDCCLPVQLFQERTNGSVLGVELDEKTIF